MKVECAVSGEEHDSDKSMQSGSGVRRYSSRRQRLDRSFLSARLQGARAYDRIAGFFSSSLLEVVGEELESVVGTIRIVCNSTLHPQDVKTARAAQTAVWRSWTGSQPEASLDSPAEGAVRGRFQRLYALLNSGKMQVRVLPDEAFGLIHGKAGVITLADGSTTCFIGSANESKSAWVLNYELVWEDTTPEAVAWLQEEFDALWGSPQAIPLAEAVIQDIQRLVKRKVIHAIEDWIPCPGEPAATDPASAFIEAPVYRKEVGLWEHQKYFVKLAFDAHCGPSGRARFVLADQVGLGKTVQLAMAAELIALTGHRPILVICPKTIVWQWQDEMQYLLDMPSAVWNGRRWVDEREFEHPVFGAEGIRKCPRRVGIVSRGLISRGSEAAFELLKLEYDCVILDEAHHARRRNLGENRDNETAEPNNLLAFMYRIAERTRSLFLATATPVQLRPIEAWDLLDILSRGDESVLGNMYSYWRNPVRALDLVMRSIDLPASEDERWEWTRNPMPPKTEAKDFEVIRQHLELADSQVVVPGDFLMKLKPPDRARINRLFPSLMLDHNPFIRRIVRRTRQQLETQIDPETNEPLIKTIQVELLGEDERDAIRLPPYLREAYTLAEDFCHLLGGRLKGSGFLKTLLLRRVGSSMHAGMLTATRMLSDWQDIETIEEEEEPEDQPGERVTQAPPDTTKILTDKERSLLEQFIDALEANQERDPKVQVVIDCLRNRGWLELGCIVFSQYYESIRWLAEQLIDEFPEEPIALYSGTTKSGIFLAGEWTPTTRETIKERIRNRELRLLLGTDAASEGLNLQSLATLINLDLPWNPTRLEQRKGRIQRIGQIHDTVQVYNLRYKDSVEDQVHQILSGRLQGIYQLFGQIPDVLEDVWVALALGEKEQAKKIIDVLPKEHPFEARYTKVEKVNWESCSMVLSAIEKRRVLSEEWR
jgi:superfamily II DNA or RNA helicase